jgi:hypothetical protein
MCVILAEAGIQGQVCVPGTLHYLTLSIGWIMAVGEFLSDGIGGAYG